MGSMFRVCICVVGFDLIQGQNVTFAYPENSLTGSDAKQIAYHAFPDSKSIELTFGSQKSIHDTLFHFRIKKASEKDTKMEEEDKDKDKDKEQAEAEASGRKPSSARSDDEPNHATPDATPSTGNTDNNKGGGDKKERTAKCEEEHHQQQQQQQQQQGQQQWYYAYAFCRQRQDKNLPRGGDQTSIVVVGTRPYMSVLQQISKIAGELYFNNGEESLKQIVQSVHGWKSMKPNGRLSIKAEEFIMPVVVPGKRVSAFDYDNFDSFDAVSPSTRFADSQARMAFSKVCLYSALSGVIKHLWHMWEAMILAEPCMIFGSNPEIVASAVSAVMDLVYPLPYAEDYRPYFTIHDPEFNAIQDPLNCKHKGNPSVIGVTNTYFLKAYKSWPNILSVGGGDSAGGLTYNSPLSSPRSPSTSGGWGKSWFSFSRSPDRGNLMNVIDSYTQELYSTVVSSVKVNYKVLGTLDVVSDTASERQWTSSASVNTRLLRKHFQELTEAFLSTFDYWFKPKEARAKNGGKSSGCGYAASLLPPQFPEFVQDDLVASLVNKKTTFPAVLLESIDGMKLVELYVKFTESRNFRPWFDSRLESSRATMLKSWAETRIDLDIKPLIKRLDEFETTDCFEIVQKQVLQEIQSTSTNTALLKKLRSDLDTLFQALPISLQKSIMLNPQTSKLMKECYQEEEGRPRRNSAPQESFESFGEDGVSPFRFFQRRSSVKEKR